MSSPEVNRIEKKLDEKSEEILSAMNKLGDRVSNLELAQARREGRESVVTKENISWKRMAMSLAQSLGYGLGAAYLIAKAFFG